MNYDAEIQKIINAAKADKALVQPWKNKIVARLDEVQAFVLMAKTRTNIKPPAGMGIDPAQPGGDVSVERFWDPNELQWKTRQVTASAANPNQHVDCTCPAYPDMRDKSCPVHGN